MPGALGLGSRLRDRGQMQLSGLDRLGLRDDLAASLGVGREHAVITEHVKPRWGDQRDEP